MGLCLLLAECGPIRIKLGGSHPDAFPDLPIHLTILDVVRKQGWKQRGGDKGGAKNYTKIKKNKVFLDSSWFSLGFPGFSLVFLKVLSSKFPPLSPQTVFSNVKCQNPLIPPPLFGPFKGFQRALKAFLRDFRGFVSEFSSGSRAKTV